MNRTVLYARVSTEDQIERYGLPTQLRACREHAEKLGLNILEEITDDGISGTIIDRPGLEAVRGMVRAGEVDVVMMLDVDRLSRELSHLLILKPEIEKHARLEFVAAKFEDSPSGRLFFGMRGVIAQYERELTRERTMRGRKERARSGLIVGGRVPYGYRYEVGHLVEDADRAPIVRRIFADYIAGFSIRAIASRLRESDAPTWGGGRWGKSSVGRILANETYAGVAHYGTHRREGKRLRLRGFADRISVSVPALIPRDVWEYVQVRLSANKQAGRPTPNYLLRGVLYCACCGRKMAGEASRKSRSYRCTGRDRLRAAGEPCRNYVQVTALDSAVWKALTHTFSNPDILRATLTSRVAELRNVAPAAIEDMRKRITRLKRKEETVLSAMFDPDLSAERTRIKAEYKAASAERHRIEAELAKVDIEQQSKASPSDWIEETSQMIRQFVQKLTDQQVMQEFVRRLVERAEWNGEQIKLFCNIVPKLATTSECCDLRRRRQEVRAWRSSGHERRENRGRSCHLPVWVPRSWF